MTFARASVIAERIKAGAFDNEDLRRWFQEIDTFRHAARSDRALNCLADRCKEVLRPLMRAMSSKLPQHTVKMDRIWPRSSPIMPFSRTDMYHDRIEHYREHDGGPVVLIGLPADGPCEVADGRHRVTAARIEEQETIRAVFAWERHPDLGGR